MDLARKYEPAHGQPEGGWKDLLRARVREAWDAGPGTCLLFEELLIRLIEPDVARRHVAREHEARERYDAGYAAAVADLTSGRPARRLKIVRRSG